MNSKSASNNSKNSSINFTQFKQIGYYRYPALSEDSIAFCCEGDAWLVAKEGGNAYRLANSNGDIRDLSFSPNAKQLACISYEEGSSEAYIIDVATGDFNRLTYFGSVLKILGWSGDGKSVLVNSSHKSAHGYSDGDVYKINVKSGAVAELNIGSALAYSVQGKTTAIGLNQLSNSGWKGYRGGAKGQIWIKEGSKNYYQILTENGGNPVSPALINDRVYYLDDIDLKAKKSVSNIYSCDFKGGDIVAETKMKDYYVRQMSVRDSTIIFHHKGQIYLYNIESKSTQKIDITLASSKNKQKRSFHYGSDFDEIVLDPQGSMVASIVRGKLLTMGLWEGAVEQLGKPNGVRYRSVEFLNEASKPSLVCIANNETSEEALQLFNLNDIKATKNIKLPAGRIQQMVASPTNSEVMVANNRGQLHSIHTKTAKKILIDSSEFGEINDLTFSHDGTLLAYSKPISINLCAIFICQLSTKKLHQISVPVGEDFCPNFDPNGKYLCFLSSRMYNPTPDSTHHNVSFNYTIKPCIVMLSNEDSLPYEQTLRAPGQTLNASEEQEAESAKMDNSKSKSKNKKAKLVPIKVDFKDIAYRVFELPVTSGIYHQIIALKDKILYTSFVSETLLKEAHDSHKSHEGELISFDFETKQVDSIAEPINWVACQGNKKTLLYYGNDQVRVVEAGININDINDDDLQYSRKSGWLKMDRMRVSIDYTSEWEQMFFETWALQKEFFWHQDMNGIDWDKVYQKYQPLLKIIASRSELSDLIREMLGELLTSHAYEYGGDYPAINNYPLGFLGCDLEFEAKSKRYKIKKILKPAPFESGNPSPLNQPGLNINEGDYLLKVKGSALKPSQSIGSLLVNQAGLEVSLAVCKPTKGSKIRTVTVKTLKSEAKLRYRDWVETNRLIVNKKTNGKVGYVHIPDMVSSGISEFFRAYLSQTHKKGLIIDVRFNSGGNVSALILEKLAHQHLGYDIPRWGASESYPSFSVNSNLVLLANEHTGSDGDMFTYAFKKLKLGTTIGTTTWGGVIGIDSRYKLNDGTLTTQPSYAFVFNDATQVENVGVDPDIKVQLTPDNRIKNQDPQLDRAILEAKKIVNIKN